MRHDIHSILFINKQVKKTLKTKGTYNSNHITQKTKNRLYLFQRGLPCLAFYHFASPVILNKIGEESALQYTFMILSKRPGCSAIYVTDKATESLG